MYIRYDRTIEFLPYLSKNIKAFFYSDSSSTFMARPICLIIWTFIDIFEGTQDTITLGGSDDIDAKLQGGDGYVFIQGSDGYVGIKDDSPSYQLDVAGTGRFTGQLNVDSNLYY